MTTGLTLRQAADRCGKSRSTVHRALKNGKLSGSRDEDGTWSIAPSELARVFPWDVSGSGQWDATGRPRESDGTAEDRAESGSISKAETEAAVLAVRVEMLEQQLERERDTVEDLRKRLDKAEDRVLALTAPASAPPQTSSSTTYSIRQAIARLFGSK